MKPEDVMAQISGTRPAPHVAYLAPGGYVGAAYLLPDGRICRKTAEAEIARQLAMKTQDAQSSPFWQRAIHNEVWASAQAQADHKIREALREVSWIEPGLIADAIRASLTAEEMARIQELADIRVSIECSSDLGSNPVKQASLAVISVEIREISHAARARISDADIASFRRRAKLARRRVFRGLVKSYSRIPDLAQLLLTQDGLNDPGIVAWLKTLPDDEVETRIRQTIAIEKSHPWERNPFSDSVKLFRLRAAYCAERYRALAARSGSNVVTLKPRARRVGSSRQSNIHGAQR